MTEDFKTLRAVLTDCISYGHQPAIEALAALERLERDYINTAKNYADVYEEAVEWRNKFISALAERDALHARLAKYELETGLLCIFHAADTTSAEDQATAFMETNFAESIHIDRRTNWSTIKTALTTAFKIAETRALMRAATTERPPIHPRDDDWPPLE